MAMPLPPVPPPPPPFAGAGAAAHGLLAAKVRNFKSSIRDAYALMTQHAAGPPAPHVLAEIENHVRQFLGDQGALADRQLLIQSQVDYCNYFRQLWPNHNAWWPQCVNAITQLNTMVQ